MKKPAKLAPFFTHLMERGKPQLEHIHQNVVINLSEQAEEILGPSGAMISASKSGYERKHPDNEVFFNACIFDVKSGEQLWFGDIDLTLSADKLQMVANKLGKKIVVTTEYPWRWEGFSEKKLKEQRAFAKRHNGRVGVREFAPDE